MLKLAHLKFVSMLNYVIQVHVASCLHVAHDILHLHDTLHALHVILLENAGNLTSLKEKCWQPYWQKLGRVNILTTSSRSNTASAIACNSTT